MLTLQPNREPFLFISDSINQVTEDHWICHVTYPKSSWFFEVHWDFFPNMPGSLQQEAITQLAGLHLISRLFPHPKYVLLRDVQKATFFKPIEPDATVVLSISLVKQSRRIFQYTGSISNPDSSSIYSKFSFSLVDPNVQTS